MTEFYKNLSLEDIHYIDADGNPKIERWVDLPSHIGMYQGSTLGRVKSLGRTLYSKGVAFRKTKDKILMQTLCKKDGYLYVSVCDKNIRFTKKVNVLIGECFLNYNDYDREKYVVDHIKNEQRQNNCLSNLQILTHRENATKDAVNQHGFPCVYKKKNRYHLSIRVNTKKTNFGVFDSPEEANEVYKIVLELLESGQDVSHLIKERVPAGAGLKGTIAKGDRFGAQATINGKTRNLGIYDTIEEAHQAYLTAVANKHLYQ